MNQMTFYCFANVNCHPCIISSIGKFFHSAQRFASTTAGQKIVTKSEVRIDSGVHFSLFRDNMHS